MWWVHRFLIRKQRNFPSFWSCFSNFVLIDEINRAPAKTQAALFEVMEERQVTVDGITHTLAPPFLVIATQNPIDQEGTYRLPEAQLDRFMVKIEVHYPSLTEDKKFSPNFISAIILLIFQRLHP